jgi:hypothetical protein
MVNRDQANLLTGSKVVVMAPGIDGNPSMFHTLEDDFIKPSKVNRFTSSGVILVTIIILVILERR